MYFNGPEALYNSGSTMRDLTIHDVISNPGVRPCGAVTLYAGATVERVLAYGADNGCSVFGGSSGAMIRDSACIGDAGYGLQAAARSRCPLTTATSPRRIDRRAEHR